jgi:dipeptidyl-peptidase-4
MMKRIGILSGLLLLVSLVFAQKKEISLEEIWREYKFFSESPEGFNFTKDGLFFTRLEVNGNQQINEYDIRSGKQTKTIYSASTNARISNYNFSDDEKKILLEKLANKISSSLQPIKSMIWSFTSGIMAPSISILLMMGMISKSFSMAKYKLLMVCA